MKLTSERQTRLDCSLGRRRFLCERFNSSSFRRFLFLLFFHHEPTRHNHFNEFRAVLAEILCKKSKRTVDIIADYTSEIARDPFDHLENFNVSSPIRIA
ncbi:hypothetical protein PUN28_018249 [Cardiocondyla obscurior]|uniref:Transposase n=1 Tax=Cardiocondyla obscurior TaxID=286306 RepID=A0AAW2EIP8_9HYME